MVLTQLVHLSQLGVLLHLGVEQHLESRHTPGVSGTASVSGQVKGITLSHLTYNTSYVYLIPHSSFLTAHTLNLTSQTSDLKTLPVDGDIVPDQPAVEVIVLPSPPIEAVAEAVDLVDGELVKEDDPARVLGVAQPVAPPRHRDSHVENMKAHNSTNITGE